MSTEKMIPGKKQYDELEKNWIQYEMKDRLILLKEAAEQNYPPAYVELSYFYEGKSSLLHEIRSSSKDDAQHKYWRQKVADNFSWFEEEDKKGTKEGRRGLIYCNHYGLNPRLQGEVDIETARKVLDDAIVKWECERSSEEANKQRVNLERGNQNSSVSNKPFFSSGLTNTPTQASPVSSTTNMTQDQNESSVPVIFSVVFG